MGLGDVLLAMGAIEADKLARGVAHGAATGQRLGSALIDLGWVEAEVIAVALAKLHGVPPAREAHFAAAAAATGAARVDPLLSGKVARAHVALPLYLVGDGKELAVAMADPKDVAAIDALAFATGKRIRPAVASVRRIRTAIEATYKVEAFDAGAARGVAAAPIAAPRTGRSRNVSVLPIVIGLAASSAGSAFTLRACRAREKGDPIAGEIADRHTGLHLTLPEEGWRHLGREDETQESAGLTMKGSVYYTGEDPDDPEVGLLLASLTASVPMPTDMDDEQFERFLRSIEQGAISEGDKSFKMEKLHCEEGDQREEQLAACEGFGTYEGKRVEVEMFCWVASSSTTVLAAFVSPRGKDEMADAIETILPTIAAPGD
jgi:hypothetical protein